MRVLVACESSGVVRDAFLRLGHDAWSCDLLPTESCDTDDRATRHLQGDVFDFIGDEWDLMIAHPPCTYLCSSGMHWTTRGLRDPKLTDDALDFVRRLMLSPIERVAIENPIGVISTRIVKPTQIIQPYMFGEDASKSTCLWLKNLPSLKATGYVEPRRVWVNGVERDRWSNQTDSGQNKLSPGADRWKKRSRTYQGIADAMAEQWGDL